MGFFWKGRGICVHKSFICRLFTEKVSSISSGIGDIKVRTTRSCNRASTRIGKGLLMKLKFRAMRAGVWFKRLSRIDRVLVDLTIKVAHRFCSPSLTSCLLSVAEKLEELCKSEFVLAVGEIGVPLACKFSLLAWKWKNKIAVAWVRNLDFARYLAVMKLNS